MRLITKEDFENLTLGSKVYYIKDNKINLYRYSGLNPMAAGWVNMIHDGNHLTVKSIKFNDVHPVLRVFTTDYNDAKEVMFSQLLNELKVVNEIYFNNSKDIMLEVKESLKENKNDN